MFLRYPISYSRTLHFFVPHQILYSVGTSGYKTQSLETIFLLILYDNIIVAN